MSMESLVKICSPQNIYGTSQQKSIAASSWTTEVDLFQNEKKKKMQIMASYSFPNIIRVSRSPMISNWFDEPQLQPL